MTAPAASVAIALGTRPEAIKLAPVIRQLRKAEAVEVQVILTGQHREMVDRVMQLFDLRVDRDLQIVRERHTLTELTCRSLEGLAELFQQLQPEMVLVQGDTTTAFAAALGAFYQKVPVGHVEAGLRSHDLANPYPEEANRRLISQLAELHFAPTRSAVANLERSGVSGEIHHTGNTVIDALLSVAERHPDCPVEGMTWQDYRVLLVTVHRRESWGAPLQGIAAGLRRILDRFPDTALLLPLHPNPAVGDSMRKQLGDHPRAFLTAPLSYPQLVGAIQRCHLLLTDSGGLQEEAPSLGKPVLVLRETTERSEAIAAGTARLVGVDPDRILAAASELLSDAASYRAMAAASNPFGDGRAAERILQAVRNRFQLAVRG